MAETLSSALKILIIVTSSGQMGEGGEPTGVWLEELAVPYLHLRDAGFDVTVVSVEGGKLPVDPRSITERGENPEPVERFLDDGQGQQILENSAALSSVNPSEFDAVFFPGGHGTMWDFPADNIGQIVSDFIAADKPVAAVCHGPAALVSATGADGKPIVDGLKVSAFTNSEEEAVGLQDAVPFSLTDRLRELGAQVKTAPDFQPFAVRDGLLITGQNPQSSEKVAELLAATLKN
ncbi:type 1 glutamine amidotransferase domain-containing protein [Wenzhouxiangella sediminis]|uniref:Type 1 glutamine amidotransferase domain-containing protein n=1 Tax=Wenzhouxiangella sediminis TaxID=1792836 RepID=A0A3E1K7G9_9GAMM|nr:type 1 glutamine amidotransferase domain-containing protein [Wenzhouxiangella sediminis]RFF29964.1 type 1 glutamine amidotransferase domain-containing protein [Wenzhouxiangella sediminis]